MRKAMQAAIASAVLALSVSAHAALPTGVTDAIDTAETDLITLLTALTAAGVAIWVARVIYNKFRVQ